MVRRKFLLWVLVLATALALLFNVPSAFAAPVALLFGLLTVGAVYFSVLLSRGEITVACAVGMLAVLVLPPDSALSAGYGIFAGGLAGSVLRGTQRKRRPRYHQTAPISQNIITLTSRVTLSYLLANMAYRAAGGQQPLAVFSTGDVVPLAVLVVTYTGLFLGIFYLAVFIDGRSVRAAIEDNWPLLLLTFVVPLPLILLNLIVFAPSTPQSTGIIIGELAMVTLGLYAFSRMRYRQQRQQQQMQALANVGLAVRADQHPDSLLETVYRELAALLFIDYFEAVLCGPDDRQVQQVLVVHDGEMAHQSATIKRLPDSLIDHILKTQAPLLFERDVRAQAQRIGLSPPKHPVSAWLGVPLLAGGHGLGALVIASTRPDQRFGDEELHVLNLIATATSAAIDNAQLYRQQTARMTRFANLNTVLALLSETLLPDDVLDRIISSASVVSEATAIAVYRYMEGAFSLVRSAGLAEDFAAMPLLTVTSGQQYEGNAITIIEDMARDERVSHLREIMRREGKTAWVELPLAVGGQTIGAICLYYDQPQGFDSEHIEFMRAFANQVAQAIQNADLYTITYRALETRVQQLSVLAAMGRRLTATMDTATICDLLLDTAINATDAGAGAVVLISRGPVEVMAMRGYPEAVFSDSTLLTQGITGRVLAGGRARYSTDVAAAEGYVAVLKSTRSQLSVPMIWRDQTLGVLTLESDRREQFDAENSAFVSQLVNQAVFALENARLFSTIMEAHGRMQAILNTMTEALILIDQHDVIALANPRVALIGLESGELVGKSLHTAIESTDLAQRTGFKSESEMIRVLRSSREMAETHRPELFAYTHNTGKGTVHVQREIIPVSDEQGEVIGMLLVFYDQTEQHQLERAREEFSQMIIHDLRSPLTAVTSSVMLLTEMIPPDSEFSTVVEKTAGSSQRAIRKLLNRVDSLLEVSRMKSGTMSLQLEVGQMGYLIENVRNELAPLALNLNIQLVAEVPADEPHLIMDTEKIERVLLNLVDNALKFSPRDSDILIRVDVYSPGVTTLLRVDVVDHGPGVPASERESIFDRFVQIQQHQTRQRRGSGLGLNFCKTAVEAHGGRIWIEDNPSGGSIFSFTLPLSSGIGPE